MARPRLEDKQKNLSEARKLYTRTQVAKQLGIGSRNTLRAYEMMAIFCVQDYRESMRVDGRIKSRRPLTHYQVWVLGKIQKMYAAVPNGCEAYTEIRKFLKENPQLTCFEAYAEEMSSLLQNFAQT